MLGVSRLDNHPPLTRNITPAPLADVGRILLFGEQHLRVTAVIAAVMLFVFRDQSVAPLLAVWLLLRGSLSSTVATAWRKVFRSYGLYIKVLAVGLILVVAPTYCRELAIDGSSLIFDWLPDASMLKGLLIFGGLGLGPLLWCYVIARPPLRTVVVLLLLPALVAAAIHWDHRLGSTLRWEEMVSAKRQPWMQQSPVQKGDVVLWPGNSQRVLFELGTASYASSFQTTGVVLSQKKTNELSVRLKRMSIASLADTWPLTKGRQAELLRKFENAIDVQHGRGRDNLHAHEPAQLTNFGLRYLCEDPALDWVVSGDTPETPVVPAIHFRDSWQEGNLSLYDCKRFRAETTQRSSPMFTIAGG